MSTVRPEPSELAAIGLFSALTPDALEWLAARLRTLTSPPGTTLLEQGARGGELYVLRPGAAALEVRIGTSVVHLATLSAGEWIGEASLIDPQPHAASVVTLSSCSLWALTAADLDAFYRADTRSYALLVLNVARQLCRKLRVSDQRLAELLAGASR